MALPHTKLYVIWLSIYLVTLIFGDETPVSPSDLEALRLVTLNKIDSFGNTEDGPELKPLIGSIVRLVFHDCAGPYNPGDTQSTVNNTIRLCDGCIDLNSNDHAGLQQLAVEPMEEICDRFTDKLNRADCWVAVGTIALEYAASLSTTPGTLPTIPYFIGRKTCALSPDAAILPTTNFPSPHTGWNPVFDFFKMFFDFDLEETTAIVGAHTLGRAHTSASGFDGRWTLDSWALNNRFFIELLDKSNEWDQREPHGAGSPQWGNKGRADDEEELFMLNVDMSIIADFENDAGDTDGQSLIDEETGVIECRWEGFDLFPSDICPRERSFDIALKYALDNQRFLRDFAVTWEKMITNNYHDLTEITLNIFRDRRDDDDFTPLPTNAPVSPTSFPSTSPTTSPTIKPIAPETTEVADAPDIKSSFCCIGQRIPNWNGRCWGKLTEEDCFNAPPGDGARCAWDTHNCRETQTCYLRGDECSTHEECCSQRCRRKVKKCR